MPNGTPWGTYLLGIGALLGAGAGVYYFKKSRALGKVNIDSTPQGAEIFLNGQDMHVVTPWKVELHPRNYDLTLKLTNYHDYSATINVNAGSEVDINAQLVHV